MSRDNTLAYITSKANTSPRDRAPPARGRRLLVLVVIIYVVPNYVVLVVIIYVVLNIRSISSNIYIYIYTRFFIIIIIIMIIIIVY